MKKIIAGILLFPYFVSACAYPTGDRWFVTHSKIDPTSLPAGVEVITTKQERYAYFTTGLASSSDGRFSSTFLLNSSRTPLIFLVTEGRGLSEGGDFVVPQELKEINDDSFNKLKRYSVLIKIQNGKTYQWIESPLIYGSTYVSKKEYLTSKKFEWSILEDGYALDEKVLNWNSIKTPNCDDVSRGDCINMKAAKKRPFYTSIPNPQSFSIPAYFGNTKFQIKGELSYELTPDYKPLPVEAGCGSGVPRSTFYAALFGVGFVVLSAVSLIIYSALKISRKSKKVTK